MKEAERKRCEWWNEYENRMRRREVTEVKRGAKAESEKRLLWEKKVEQMKSKKGEEGRSVFGRCKMRKQKMPGGGEHEGAD